jgi:hypothetical protein
MRKHSFKRTLCCLGILVNEGKHSFKRILCCPGILVNAQAQFQAHPVLPRHPPTAV